jgi:fumarate reductase subunit D
MVPSARRDQSSCMPPHWTVYAAGGCSIALAIAIVVMILLA